MEAGIRAVYNAATSQDPHLEVFDHPYDIEGKKGWAHEYIAPLKNDAGDIIGVTGVVTDITDRKNLENKLRERDETLSKLSAQIPGVIYLYRMFPDGRSCFPFASEGIREIYEVSPDEVKEDATKVIGGSAGSEAGQGPAKKKTAVCFGMGISVILPNRKK